MKNTVLTFKEAKKNKDKLTMLTAYDYTTAKLFDESGINSILVGDSLGMVMLGYEDTLSVTMEDMIHHTRAVSRGVKNAMVVSDMPFLSYNTGIRDAVINAGRLMAQGRADCVKLEGGKEVCDVIRAITDAKIPVCAHIGLTPQAINALGGFKVQGKDLDSARAIIEDALAVQEAGAFAVVLECVPAPLASKISEMLDIPTIGIGAGHDCDGQVLVYQDMLGLYKDFTPKFVKRFADVGQQMDQGVRDYIQAVKDGSFPEPAHSFKMDEEIVKEL
ncbi:3-methyl-2-oxobutanoate hydroxymethyltransferase [Peptostreptococcus anaerobius]|uniref:3-methyl-2-oxobutanoate hydroxymethyltransferase n=1 Tax=Peptostreptococcus anaerobius TaxID=1261 RepID=UPI001898346F|nr:3-methyl-2-oxobutanoate hydroxymethyltransferase [Peptostreptococcus anaerobius]MDB8852691.1 3-methyl-2-oxobutanoate hydroxymethyltransferase [Peptostreptococcus anaerobius]MDU0964904.1 3-methyl-2-oxobutanoate hydroxymethyltransferase [Peptostreptococcus anaerobius]MDU0998651.1 3-methyl-2-oxobutanoate hydroxymethyltransferase [Peptostreptococcus anaerobius]